MAETEPLMVDCGPHGMRVAAVVCQHLLKVRDRRIGFVENSHDPNDLQAWCNDCEDFYLREQGRTPEFVEFNGMSVVCVVCYQEARNRHDEPASI